MTSQEQDAVRALIVKWRTRGPAQRSPFYDSAAHHHSWSWDACADELELALESAPPAERKDR